MNSATEPVPDRIAASIRGRGQVSRWLWSGGYILRNHLLRQSTLKTQPLALEGELFVARDDFIGRRLFKRGIHEQQTTTFLARAARAYPQDVILDVGAHCGFFARLLSEAAPDAALLAFEADPSNFALLQRNFAGLQRRVEPIHCALSDASGSVRLHRYKKVNQGKHSLIPFHSETGGGSVEVPAQSLDEFWSEWNEDGSRRPTLWKMDVEGAEYLVLRGAEKVASQCPLIVAEFSAAFLERAGISSGDHVRQFEELGFEPWLVTDDGSLSKADRSDLAQGRERKFEVAWVHRKLLLETPHFAAIRG
ncbi:MAG: FkbM family methyltransferase [Planctomycetota bacterium]